MSNIFIRERGAGVSPIVCSELNSELHLEPTLYAMVSSYYNYKFVAYRAGVAKMLDPSSV